MFDKMDRITKKDLAGRIALFADGVDPESMQSLMDNYGVVGFTTNPSLMAKLGVKDYRLFAQDMLQRARGLPVSFEVIADDTDGMRKQAETIASWGSNAYVKIPITNTAGVPTYDLIKQLNGMGVKLNITAIFTKEQIDGLEHCFSTDTPAVVSVFAGRIADAGQDPSEYVRYSVSKFKDSPHVKTLWASTRELYNVVQAIDSGAHIITATKDILKKLDAMGKDLTQFSRETVQMFRDDSLRSGFTL